jgi:hypothetical protein
MVASPLPRCTLSASRNSPSFSLTTAGAGTGVGSGVDVGGTGVGGAGVGSGAGVAVGSGVGADCNAVLLPVIAGIGVATVAGSGVGRDVGCVTGSGSGVACVVWISEAEGVGLTGAVVFGIGVLTTIGCEGVSQMRLRWLRQPLTVQHLQLYRP